LSAWIEMIDDANAVGELAAALKLARTPHGTVDSVMRVHSLRPATMHGHLLLYRAALHNDANTIPMWLQECLASWVSLLNGCDYSLSNHWANARHLIGDEAKANKIEAALKARRPADGFEPSEFALFRYAEKLTLAPQDMIEADVTALRDAGFDDGQILEANQIIAYFCYVNRSLNGLGVTTESDVVGYYEQQPPKESS